MIGIGSNGFSWTTTSIGRTTAGTIGQHKGNLRKGVSEHEKSLTWPFCGLPAGGRFRDDRGRYLRHTVLGCGRPDGFYGCHDYVCAAVRRSGLLAAELTRRLSLCQKIQVAAEHHPVPKQAVRDVPIILRIRRVCSKR